MKLSEQIKKIIIALLLGSTTGLIVACFFKCLQWIQIFHETHRAYILLLPIVWLMLKLTKKMTLYFPVAVSEVYMTTPATYKYWNKLSIVFNFFGSILSHFSGASIGREGVAVTLSSSMAQIAGLDWVFWRSIVIASSFGIATGSPWVSIVFLFEVFDSNFEQKILTVVVSWAGCLVMQNFQIPQLLPHFFVLGVNSFSEKLFFVFAGAAVIGVTSRFYKSIYFNLKNRLNQMPIWIVFCVVLIISFILFQSQFKNIHSLSLERFERLSSGNISPEFLFYKFIFTLFFVSVGFWGGEFVPSVLIGSGLGIILAKYFSIDPAFGLMLGSFSFFCGLTKLKWTALTLTALLVGFHQLIWVYLFLTACRWFSGPTSIYTNEKSDQSVFWKN